MEGFRGGRWGATVSIVVLLIGIACGFGDLRAGPIVIPIKGLDLSPNSGNPKDQSDFSALRLRIGAFSLPALWGMRVVGADIAKQDLQDLPRLPVNVVVSDAGVKVGASRVFEVPGDPRKPRRIKLKITSSVSPELIQGLLRPIVGAIPDEIDDPFDPTRAMDTSHGTHVAGIIGALNAEFGVSPFSQIIDMNIFKGMNLYKEENFAAALRSLANSAERVDVINMSHGIPAVPAIRDPLKQIAQKKNALLVAAAGNEGGLMIGGHPLAQKDDLFVVGAINYSGARAHFSNMGPSLDVVAPGEEILSRGSELKFANQDLELMTGTSMAAPFVSGTFATLKALLPKARANDLKKIVRETSIDLGAEGFDWQYGHGLINEVRAVALASRLVRNGLTSKGAVTLALTVPGFLSFQELERKSLIEGRRMGLASPEYERSLRRAVLLSGDPDRFEDLMIHSITLGDLASAAMWGFMWANHSAARVQETKLRVVASLAWAGQLNRLKTGPDPLSILFSIANVDLALKMYETSPEAITSSVEPILRQQILVLDPRRLADLDALVAKKHPAPSENGPVLATNTANSESLTPK